jgi:hypothetical protein
MPRILGTFQPDVRVTSTLKKLGPFDSWVWELIRAPINPLTQSFILNGRNTERKALFVFAS